MVLPEILFGEDLEGAGVEGELVLSAKAELPQNAFSRGNGAQRAVML